jgi:hypothetical protein
MTDKLRSRPARTRRDFPVGVPVTPPPGWRPHTPLPPRSPFRAQVALVLKALLLSLLVMVCMGVGWLLTQGRRPARKGTDVVVLASTKTVPDDQATRPRRRRERSPERKEREDERERRRRTRDELPASGNDRPTRPQPQPMLREEPPPRPTPTPTPTPRPRDELTYEKHILPIMQRACISCHGGNKKRGGLDLRTFAALLRGGDSGAGVLPGKPNESPLYETIAAGRMPPKRKLPVADKERIRQWIAQGARSDQAGR